MKKENTLTLSNAVFLLLFAFSVFFDGFLQSALYLIAFVAATLVGAYRAPSDEDRLAPLAPPSARNALLALPLVAPIIALTMLTALAFTALFSLVGASSDVALGENFGAALLAHALLPAICEELLFRYLPILLLGRDNPKGLILTSALFFALGHVSLVHLPYALLAGVCYMALALVTGSVWPCILTHFLNNLLSLLLTFFPSASGAILISFSALTLVSIAAIVIHRRVYLEQVRPLLVGRSHEYLTRWPIVYAAAVLVLCALAI